MPLASRSRASSSSEGCAKRGGSWPRKCLNVSVKRTCPFGHSVHVRIVVGADDEGAVADAVVEELRARGHDVRVVEREQWPDVAARVARAVAAGEADQGMLFCWTGTGTSMAANKVPGVRAALAWDPWIAEGARKWNDANVLVMSLKRTDPETAREIVAAWLSVEAPDPDEAANIARLGELER
jgi:ribose 5-phosphate isomerase B